MKKINKIVSLLLLSLVFIACEKSEPKLTINDKDIKSEVTVSTDKVVLKEDVQQEDALTVTMTKPTFKVNVTPKYKLVVKIGEKFESKMSIQGGDQPVGGGVSRVFSSVELNKLLLNAGAKPDVETEVHFSGLIELGTKKIVSAKKTVKVTPYFMPLDLTTTWGVVGSATPNGWNGPDLPFYKNTQNPAEMVAYVTLVDGEIKFRENNDWKNNFGDNGADGTLESGGANIAVTAGTYKITTNLSALTYTIEKFAWAITGTATSGTDVALEYDPTTDMWKAETTLVAGNIKFRKNEDDAQVLGLGDAEGTLKENGADIAVEAGKYLIEVNLNDNTYTMTKK